MTVKQCSVCKKYLDITNFYKHAGHFDGLSSACKSCTLKQRKEYYITHKEKILQCHREYKKNNKERIREINKKYREKNRDKIRQRQKEIMSRPIARYKQYKRNAKTRNIAFELSFEKFNSLISKPCYYCGSTEKIGIDRKENGVGYTIENSVPCCKICNMMKWKYSFDNFITQCKKISKNHGGV